MTPDKSEAGQLKMLYEIMWEKSLVLQNVENGKDEEKTTIDAAGNMVKESYKTYIYQHEGQEVLRVSQSKTHPENILLTIGGKPKNWSKKSLEHILQDVLTLQETIKKARAEMLDKSQKEIDQQHKDPAEATTAFLAQFMPREVKTI